MASKRFSTLLKSVLSYTLLIFASIFALGPIYWAINTSLKTQSAAITYPPKWFPQPVVFEHYAWVFQDPTMPRYFLNSILLALGTILVVAFVSIHAAYAAARFSFSGKNGLLFLLLATIMIPGIVTLIPLYLITIKLGLHNTFIALILVYASWQTPTAIWLLRGFFESIPKELEESAMIDGCSRIGAFYRVILPLAQPGLAAAAIINFVYVWNEFIIALNLTSSDKIRPVTVGLKFLVGESGILWGKITAASVLALIPIIVLFIFLQQRFIQGLTAGAVKG